MRFYKSSEVADMCGCDLKTVHNWADDGKLDVFRTPGGHIRVTPRVLRDFLEKYGFPVPGDLA